MSTSLPPEPAAAPPADSQAVILVVDDEPNICESVQKALQRTGYEVVTCSDAAQALKWLETRSADLVLCDIRMPAMDGLELLSKMKQLDPLVSVVMITGFAAPRASLARSSAST